MFNKFISGINWMRNPFSFEDYWAGLLETSAMGGPSVEEARRDYERLPDYRAMHFSNSLLVIFGQ